MKAILLTAKTFAYVFVGGLFLWTSGISSAVLAHHTGETSKTQMHNRPSQVGKLDGKSFTVNLLEPGKSPVTDSLIFRSGSFKSTAYRSYGFGMGKYTSKESNNALTFNAKTISSSEGTMVGSGLKAQRHSCVPESVPGFFPSRLQIWPILYQLYSTWV